MAAEEKGEAVQAAGAGGGTGKLVMILTGVNVAVTLAMAGLLFYSFKRDNQKARIDDLNPAAEAQAEAAAVGKDGKPVAKDGKDPKADKKAPAFGKMVTLEQFTVNLSTPGSVNPKFVRVNISLEVPGEDSETEVTQKMPQVRNTIIDLFNSKRPSDLATAEGRDYLKEEIRNALNSFMITGKVKGVFFTNFALTG